MKVYQITFPRLDDFAAHNQDGTFFRCKDRKHLFPHVRSLWDKANNTYKPCGPPYYDRVFVPSFFVKKEDYKDYINLNLRGCVETILQFDLPITDDDSKNYNIFIFRKYLDENIEVGFSYLVGRGEHECKRLTKKVQQILKLKAFW